MINLKYLSLKYNMIFIKFCKVLYFNLYRIRAPIFDKNIGRDIS